MKIFFSGYHNPDFETVTEYSERAIISLGHEVQSVDDRSFILPGRIRARVPWLHRLDLQIMNLRILRLLRRFSPDLLFVTGGHRILPSTLKAVRDMKIRTALWTIDAPTDFKPVEDAAAQYDRIFCGGTEAIGILEKRGLKNIHWLPFACELETHKPVSLTRDEAALWGSDIVFVGSFYKNRAALLRELTDTNLKIWGPGWREKLPAADPLQKHLYGGKTRPGEWIKILSASKVVVIVHFQDGSTPCFQASPKVYETLACGAFALVDDQKDVFALFQDDRHLVKFSNAVNLREKIKYYLEHPGERLAIAAEGRREIGEKHTYVHRMREMISFLG
jgi:spore maturation protein CgeB